MKGQLCRTAAEELEELTEICTTLTEKGFAVDLRADADRWIRAIRSLGRDKAYRLMSETLCALYESRFGKEYLFSEDCLAFEIAYHANAYFRLRGCRDFPVHPTALLFSREELERHCEIVNISTDDVSVLRQRLMFGYARGVRPRYRNTPADPFDRSGFLRRSGRRRRD